MFLLGNSRHYYNLMGYPFYLFSLFLRFLRNLYSFKIAIALTNNNKASNIDRKEKAIYLILFIFINLNQLLKDVRPLLAILFNRPLFCPFGFFLVSIILRFYLIVSKS